MTLRRYEGLEREYAVLFNSSSAVTFLRIHSGHIYRLLDAPPFQPPISSESTSLARSADNSKREQTSSPLPHTPTGLFNCCCRHHPRRMDVQLDYFSCEKCERGNGLALRAVHHVAIASFSRTTRKGDEWCALSTTISIPNVQGCKSIRGDNSVVKKIPFLGVFSRCLASS